MDTTTSRDPADPAAQPTPETPTFPGVRLNAPLDETFRLDAGPGLDAGRLADDASNPPAAPALESLDLELGDASAPDSGPSGLGDADATPEP